VRAAKLVTDRKGPRGHDLFLRTDGSVVVSGRLPFYTRAEDVHYIDHAELVCPLGTIRALTRALALLPPGQESQPKPKQTWTSRPFQENVAVALSKNAAVVAGADRRFETPEGPPRETYGIAALDIKSGRPLWKRPLPAAPVAWGIAIGRNSSVLVTVRDGRVICFRPEP